MKFWSPLEHLEGSLLPRLVAVEGEHHLPMQPVVGTEKPLQPPRMVIAEGRTARGDRRVDAGDVGGHDIGVSLDDDGLGTFADRLPGEVEPVEHLRLLVDRGLGGVDVLGGKTVVVVDASGAEAEHGAGRVPDRPQQSADEEVTSPVPDESRGLEGLVVESLAPQVVAEHESPTWRVAQREVPRMVPVEASLVQELPGDERIRGAKLGGEELAGGLIGLEHPFPESGGLTRPLPVVDGA